MYLLAPFLKAYTKLLNKIKNNKISYFALSGWRNDRFSIGSSWPTWSCQSKKRYSKYRIWKIRRISYSTYTFARVSTNNKHLIQLVSNLLHLPQKSFCFPTPRYKGAPWAQHHRKRRDTANFNRKYMPSQDISEKDIQIRSQIHTRIQVNRENSSLGIAFGMLITSIVLNIFLSYCLYLRNSRLNYFLRQDINLRSSLFL